MRLLILITGIVLWSAVIYNFAIELSTVKPNIETIVKQGVSK